MFYLQYFYNKNSRLCPDFYGLYEAIIMETVLLLGFIYKRKYKAPPSSKGSSCRRYPPFPKGKGFLNLRQGPRVLLHHSREIFLFR